MRCQKHPSSDPLHCSFPLDTHTAIVPLGSIGGFIVAMVLDVAWG